VFAPETVSRSAKPPTSGIILPVSKLLQKKEFYIFAVIELIDDVLDTLRQNRSNCENVFHKIFDQAKNECEKFDASLLIPRRCKSQIFRDNYPLMILRIFSGSHICTVFRSFDSGNGE